MFNSGKYKYVGLVLAFMLASVFSFAQVFPNNFTEETAPDSSNFELYSQKNGLPRRANLHTLKRYFDQNIYTSGDSLYLTTATGDTAVNLTRYLQSLTLSNDTLYISDSNYVVLDSSNTDNQSLSINADTLSLERGGDIVLGVYRQTVDSFYIQGSNLYISLSGDNVDAVAVDISSIGGGGLGQVVSDNTLSGFGTFNSPLKIDTTLIATVNDVNAISNNGVTDGDKGDVIVTGTGSVWTIDPTVVETDTLVQDSIIVHYRNGLETRRDTVRTPGGSGSLSQGVLNDSIAELRSYIENIIEYDAGNGAIVWATDPGVTFVRTSSTEGTFTIPDTVMLISGVIHHTAAQNPGSTYYVQFNLQGSRLSNNSLTDINPPKNIRVLNKYASTLLSSVSRATPIDYNKTVNSPNLDIKITGLSPLEIQLNNYNDANSGGSNDTIITFSF